MAGGIILFDGTCAFCERSVRFIATRDGGYFKFGASQNPEGAGAAGEVRHQPRGDAQSHPDRRRRDLAAIDGGVEDCAADDRAVALGGGVAAGATRRFAMPCIASSPRFVTAWPASPTRARSRRRKSAPA